MAIKYPRTFHLPWSSGKTNDDKVMKSTNCFHNKQVIVTLKMDGENTTLYSDGIHARSLDYSYHESRSWIQNKHAEIAHLIPNQMRICGENLFAKHSIFYEDLDSYFMVFSVWKEQTCLSWVETKKIVEHLGLITVPVLYEGIYNENLIKKIFNKYSKEHEGYVIRLADEFLYEDFSISCGKNVRKNHVQTSEHWKNQKIFKNKLKT